MDATLIDIEGHDKDVLMKMALGRLFSMMMRPTAPGDIEQFEKIKELITHLAGPQLPGYQHNYARDRLLGSWS
jgi:hypothetical protein